MTMASERWVIGAGGFVSYLRLDDPPDDVAEAYARLGCSLMFVAEVFVHPLRRSRGHSRVLMETVAQWADRSRVDLWLYCAPFGLRTVRAKPIHRPDAEQLAAFYAKFGFKPADGTGTETEMLRRCK